MGEKFNAVSCGLFKMCRFPSVSLLAGQNRGKSQMRLKANPEDLQFKVKIMQLIMQSDPIYVGAWTLPPMYLAVLLSALPGCVGHTEGTCISLEVVLSARGSLWIKERSTFPIPLSVSKSTGISMVLHAFCIKVEIRNALTFWWFCVLRQSFPMEARTVSYCLWRRGRSQGKNIAFPLNHWDLLQYSKLRNIFFVIIV